MQQELISYIEQANKQIIVSGLRGSSSALIASTIAKGQNCCVVVPDEHQVPLYEQDLKLFTDAPVLSYYGYEIPPYTPLSPDQQTTAARIATLHQLQDNNKSHIVVVSAEAVMRRVIPKAILEQVSELVMAENDCDRDELIIKFEQLGYERVPLVQTVGDFSVRGGIVDIFPPNFPLSHGNLSDGPIRLDFFGDTIETIRCFDPISQRSHSKIEEALFLPVHDTLLPTPKTAEQKVLTKAWNNYKENLLWDDSGSNHILEQLKNGQRFAGIEFFLPLFYNTNGGSDTLFDYLGKNTCFLLHDPDSIRQNMNLINERIASNYNEATTQNSPALPPEDIFLLPGEFDEVIQNVKTIHCTDFISPGSNEFVCKTSNHQLLKQEIGIQRRTRGLLAPLTDQILKWQEQGDSVVICCRSSKRTKNLAELLQKFHHSIHLIQAPLHIDQIQKNGKNSALLLCNHPLAIGFSLPEEKVHILSESELFGEMRLGTKTKAKHQKGEPILFAELNDADIIVHRDHGLGIYLGLVTMEFQAVKNDFMLLEYRDGDKLYLPVDRLNLITRYEGISDQQPKLDKLGTQSWRATKAKVKEEVWKVAQELLDIYARREIQRGRQFSAPGELFHELEESFPFDETPGQDKAITETIADLTSKTPTDRLVCGDVGYGKTEVAIRAAFKVVEDGFQVAILVPTTVLAEQHAKTFRDRLQGFPVNIACINRFRTSAQQKQMVKDLATGEINIIIGTHRLLSKDIVFNNLGLLIVDEEHRFGVSHKEKIKKIRADVDILTLTATPIPRTLQMSLLGIRDLSVISTPPEHRRPVKTFVAEFDDLVIKEAVTKEMRRNGQVFFVHNRVKTIHQMAANVQKLVPGARLAVAHGQMAGKELEDIMVAFVNKEIDVLLCTTIIESGLDIPSANTIIIDRADRLGLAEIYQLRGRVGRSNLQSYAYLLVPSLDSLTKDSKDRLRALMDCNELGGGFKLAMSDLQIRGGGNLLGVSQSGNIAAIGYDLYLDLLQKTVTDLKNSGLPGNSEGIIEEIDPELNLQISAYIPEDYIRDVSQRYLIYRRIAALSGCESDVHDDLLDELEDRYGAVPKETHNLFKIVSLKRELIKLRINKLEKGPNALVFSFMEDTPIAPEKLLHYLQTKNTRKAKNPPRLTPDGRLVVTAEFKSIEDIFTAVRQTLTELTTLTHGN